MSPNLFCAYYVCRVPNKHDFKFGVIRQNNLCMDTLGHSSGGTIGLYSCHGSGGNQVRTLIHLELNTEQNLLSIKTF